MEPQVTERNQFSFGFYFLFTALGVLLDQAVKFFIHSPFRNYNFAFSVVLPKPIIYGIYILVLAAVIIFLVRQNTKLNKMQQFSWSLVLAGAVSNIGERIVLGYVRDFIYLFGGILNIADFLIIVGILLLLSEELFPGLREKFRK